MTSKRGCTRRCSPSQHFKRESKNTKVRFKKRTLVFLLRVRELHPLPSAYGADMQLLHLPAKMDYSVVSAIVKNKN